MGEFAGDNESQYLFLGYQQFTSYDFSGGLRRLVDTIPSMAKVFANPGAELRIPKNPRKLVNLIKHRADSNQMGRGYKIQWGISRDVMPYQDRPNVETTPGAIIEIKILFHLPTGQTCGCVEFPKGQYTFFYKEKAPQVFVQAEGVPQIEVQKEPEAS